MLPITSILCRTSLVLKRNLANASDGSQWSPQFVGDVSREAAQLIECGLQSPEHGVENGPELS